MHDPLPLAARRQASTALVRALRALDQGNGVRHSGIALDVILLLYEPRGEAATVKELCQLSGYSGPTIRLVIRRLVKEKTLVAAGRNGRTMRYGLSERGAAAFDRYMETIWAFGQAVASGDLAGFTAAAATIPVPDRRAGRRRPRAQRADARLAQAAEA